MYGGEEKYIQDFGRESEVKGPLAGLRHWWENNIEIALKEGRSQNKVTLCVIMWLQNGQGI
jgi:hypothetical protein